MDDVRVENFAAMLQFLDPFPEMTVRLDKRGTRYKSQKAHMVIWWQSQITTGAKGYTRMKGNNSSRKCYNRLLNSGALIWLADAFGEDPAVLEQAVRRMDETEDYREKCAMFREVIPFDRLYELAHDPQLWRIDPALKPFLKYDRGFPYVSKPYEAQYKQVLEKELG